MPMPSLAMNYVDSTLLAMGGHPNNVVSSDLLQAWMMEEGTWQSSNANYVGRIHNPLDSTLPAQGATNFNSIGVKRYTNMSQGVKETVATLNEPQYHVLKNAIVTGNAKEFFSSSGRQELSIWASGNPVSDSAYSKQLSSIYTGITHSQSPLAPMAGNVAQSVGKGVSGLTSFFKNLFSSQHLILLGLSIIFIIIIAIWVWKAV